MASTDPRQLLADQHVDHAAAAERGSHRDAEQAIGDLAHDPGLRAVRMRTHGVQHVRGGVVRHRRGEPRRLAIPHIYAVTNKVRSNDDQAAIESFCAKHGMRLLGAVPLDEAFVEAERFGLAPLDHPPHSPGLEAIRELASRIGGLEGSASRSAGAGLDQDAQQLGPS